MKFLFQTRLRQRGLELDYNVYEFKLYPGMFRAELITPDKIAVKEIIFWKEKEIWKVQPSEESAERLARQIAADIERFRNR